jgi:hypothetical protein
MVHVFDDPFLETLDVIVNVLDNVNSLLYMDSHCMYFQKSMSKLDTLGTKCHTYGDSKYETIMGYHEIHQKNKHSYALSILSFTTLTIA